MEGVDPGWKVPPELEGEELPAASVFDALERLTSAHWHPSAPIEDWTADGARLKRRNSNRLTAAAEN